MGKEAGWEEQRAVQRAAQGREAVHQGSSHWQRKMWLKKLLHPQPTLKGQPLIFLRKGFILFFPPPCLSVSLNEALPLQWVFWSRERGSLTG